MREIVGDDTREFILDKVGGSGLFCAILAHTGHVLCFSPSAAEREKSVV